MPGLEKPSTARHPQARVRRGRPPRLEARRDILAALGELLARHEIDTISVEDIVRRSGLSRATFYKHFQSRDDALVDLFSEVADGVRQEVLEALRCADEPRTFIENGVRAYLRAITSLGRLAAAFDAAQYRLPEMYARREKTVRSYMDEVSHMLEHTGLPAVPPLLLEGLIAGIDRVAQRTALTRETTGEEPDIEALIRETGQTFTNFLQFYLEGGYHDPAR